jgi:hypothetical protein
MTDHSRALSLACAACVLAATAASTPVEAVQLGVNIDTDGATAEINARRAEILKYRNINAARIGIPDSWGDTAMRRDQAARIVANGGVVQAAIFPTFTWDNSCSQDLAGVESRAYDETAVAVNKLKDLVHDFELMNETQDRPEISGQIPVNSVGTETAPYEGKPCMASLSAALRGMSRAIVDIRASSGLPLRIIMGVIGRDWGYLTYLQRQGVRFDVVGWHVYPNLNNRSLGSDTWYGPGGPYAQLAAFGKPVHVNEFNCHEAYTSGFENQAGQPVTESCLRSFNKHLRDLLGQKTANIEYVHAYELVDGPGKPGSEKGFGLMNDLAHDKPLMYLFTAFTGGQLTAQERDEVTSRGLMTASEIDARRAALH